MNSNFRNLALWVIIVLLLLALFTLFQSPQQRAGASDLPFSQFLTEADAGRVSVASIAHALSGGAVGGTTAAVLDGLVLAAADPGGEVLRPLLDYLPVAGGTGTLAVRFQEGDRRGAGWVRAKTGTLEGVSTLTGYTATRDGRVLTFALMSQDSMPFEARPALDAIAAELQECGCR